MNAASNIFLGQAMAPLLIKVNYRYTNMNK